MMIVRSAQICAMAVAFVIAIAVHPLAARAAGFLSVYEDLPLPTGLIEVPGSALSFDSPEGRIVEAEAAGTLELQSVRKFYGTTLPQLGWTQDGPAQFHREQETLRVEIAAGPKDTVTVKFTVSPTGASSK